MRLTFSALLGVVICGCAPALVRGAPCVRDSECPGELACLGGRCREECLQQGDCPQPARCVSIGGLGRCLYDEENECVDSAGCGAAELVCQGGHCFNTCERCAELGAVCSDGVCVRTETVDASRAPRDGGGAPVFSPHIGCVDAGDCLEGEVCAGDDGARPVCRVPCVGPPDAGAAPATDDACASRSCVRPADDFSVAYCALTCDPFDPGSCPAGEACDRVPRLRPTTGEERLVWTCRVVQTPTSTIDGPCNTMVPGRCPAGSRCFSPSGAGDGLCLPFCNDTSSVCLGDRTCVSSHDDQYPVGLCMPRSGMDAGT